VLTTGGSVKKVIEVVRSLGGRVVGLGALCNRGGITAEDVGNVPKLQALVSINLEAWEPNDCPLCKQNVAINTNVGKGREFLERQKK
jgi:orotate phosphoribosyltransferase